MHYTINVRLDTARNALHGNIRITFVNSSPDTLHELVVLLYPNAYSGRNTAYTRQKLHHGYLDAYFASADQRGFVDSLDFVVNGRPAFCELEEDNPDIGHVRLAQPVNPGSSVELQTTFRVKIPAFRSRLGHFDGEYFITQWYPKIAMYDSAGWHAYPYLDIGEYYAEFANYNVRIDVPEDFKVASTGKLVNQINGISTDAEGSPPLTAWYFEARRVIDFAWFGSAEFSVVENTITIAGNPVHCKVYTTSYAPGYWENALQLLNESLQYMSGEVGPYPYDAIAVVQGPYHVFGGMEYPGITLIGGAGSERGLAQLIIHEVAHNWFQAILATNERSYPWLDEGFASFFEQRFMMEKYGSNTEDLLPWYLQWRNSKLSDAQIINIDLERKRRLRNSLNAPAVQSQTAYFANAYYRPALALAMLEAFLGTDMMDSCIAEYYKTWKFKHPTPEDVRAVFESMCSCDLSWFFDEIINSAASPEYAIRPGKAHENYIEIQSGNSVQIPVELLEQRGSTLNSSKWFYPACSDTLSEITSDSADRISAYRSSYSLDPTPHNNTLVRNERSWIRQGFSIGLPGGRYRSRSRTLRIAPLVGWNNYDGGLLGVHLSNIEFPTPSFRWTFNPMYGVDSRSIGGFGRFSYKNYPDNATIEVWEAGVSGRSFHYDRNADIGFVDRFLRIDPFVSLSMNGRSGNPSIRHFVQYRFIYVRQNYGLVTNPVESVWRRESRSYAMNELTYRRTSDNTLRPSELSVTVTQGARFLRLATTYRQEFVYNRWGKSVHIRAFAGILPYFDEPGANVQFYYNGTGSEGEFTNDYGYDAWMFGRTEETGFLSQQVFNKDAQVKTLWAGGVSDQWMLSAGLAVDIPGPVPLRPYFDMVLSPLRNGSDVTFDYSGGISIILIKNALEVYVPLLESRNIRTSDYYNARPGFFQRVSFMFDLNALDPLRKLDNYLE